MDQNWFYGLSLWFNTKITLTCATLQDREALFMAMGRLIAMNRDELVFATQDSMSPFDC